MWKKGRPSEANCTKCLFKVLRVEPTCSIEPMNSAFRTRFGGHFGPEA